MIGAATHEHVMRRARPQAHPLDVSWFRCAVEGCTATTHPRACVDDEGKVECVCGLADLDERRAELAEPR